MFSCFIQSETNYVKKNKTNHPILSKSHPSATANKAINSLKIKHICLKSFSLCSKLGISCLNLGKKDMKCH